jgi:hypothetical protein
MIKRLFAILILLQIFFPGSLAQDPDKDNLLRQIIDRDGQATVVLPYPGASETDNISRHVSIGSLKDKLLEIVLSPVTIDWFISRKYNYRIIQNEDIKGIESAYDVAEAMEWDKYPTYTQYDSIMKSFADLYPAICLLDTIGTTNYGKLVLALKISDNPHSDEDEPEVFYTSSIHGDETGGYILMLRLADLLLKNYSTPGRVRNLVDNLEIWINPLANPDGTYRTGNTISSPTRGNALGYDLNRNYPDPVSEDPVRQKETIDMMNFMRSRHFSLSVNFHAGEEVVNYPWDRWERRHADDEWFWNISRKYADTVHLHAVAGYMTFLDNGVTNGWDWYYVYGGRQDYVTWELKGREVTIELDDIKLTPAANLNSLWEYNWRSLLGYLENALYGIHGKVTDSSTGEPVAARIVIREHDIDNSFVFSDTITGGFTRFLAPGTWTLDFTANRYVNKSLDVNVVADQMTWVDIGLDPLINPIDTTTVTGLFLYPNPANEYLKVILPDRQTGIVEIRIINSLGVEIRQGSQSRIEHTLKDVPLYINVRGLKEGVYTLIIINTADRVSDKASFVIIHRQ